MTKDVLLSIAGLQYGTDQSDTVEVISCGTYRKRNGKHYILYEEVLEEQGDLVTSMAKCMLKVSDGQVELLKKGSVNAQMIFEEAKTHMTYYNTGFGDLVISISTNSIEVVEETELITVHLKYTLELNYQHISECNLMIKVQATKG